MTGGEVDIYEVWGIEIEGIRVERAVTWVDKSAWGDGPWDAEPDKVQWTDERTGLPCLAVRNADAGHWCGYVGVGPDHPYYEADPAGLDLSVHGGVTYGAVCQEFEGAEAIGVCHVPQPGQPEPTFWIGFDCAHGRDRKPGIEALLEPPLRLRFAEAQQYRTLRYVMGEVAELAEQIWEVWH